MISQHSLTTTTRFRHVATEFHAREREKSLNYFHFTTFTETVELICTKTVRQQLDLWQRKERTPTLSNSQSFSLLTRTEEAPRLTCGLFCCLFGSTAVFLSFIRIRRKPNDNCKGSDATSVHLQYATRKYRFSQTSFCKVTKATERKENVSVLPWKAGKRVENRFLHQL